MYKRIISLWSQCIPFRHYCLCCVYIDTSLRYVEEHSDDDLSTYDLNSMKNSMEEIAFGCLHDGGQLGHFFPLGKFC